MSRARDRAEVVRCLESLLPGLHAKGNGMVLGAAAEDGRAIPFELLRVRFGHPRIRTGGLSRMMKQITRQTIGDVAVDIAEGGTP